LFFKGVELLKFAELPEESTPSTLRIRDIRTVGSRDSKLKHFPMEANKGVRKPLDQQKPNAIQPPKQDISLKDLSLDKPQALSERVARPGTRPETTAERGKAISAISLKGRQIREFMQGSPVSASAGDPRSNSLARSDVLVNLEVPEGVNPDELNKFELMFYGFQRRTAINYINAFYKNLSKFERENPHKTFPLTDSKQVMTGRLTYDERGNVKQIKMVQWSNVEGLQDFFVEVLKDMDTLHNPPQALWEKTGEFSIYFSLIVNG
jgi:hypothetical protein